MRWSENTFAKMIDPLPLIVDRHHELKGSFSPPGDRSAEADLCHRDERFLADHLDLKRQT